MTTWFHATRVKDWHDTVLHSPVLPLVHVGTQRAAQDRAHRMTRFGLRITENHFLHEIIITGNPRIDTNVRIDDDDLHPLVINDLDFDGYYYVNDHEDEGSRSLLINPAFLRVVRTGHLRPTRNN